MAADMSVALPVTRGVLHTQRRSLVLWSIAVAAVSAIYVSFYPAMGGGGEMQAMIDSMPDSMVTALGYDQIGTPGGYLSSTVYGILGPILLLVFAIGTGARLIAGNEEDGSLELELTAPVSRRQVFVERLVTLAVDVVLLVAVLTLVTIALVTALDMDVAADRILAGSTGLLLLVLGFGTLALAVGAATGRRGIALGTAAGLAVVSFMLDAIGPTVEMDWMTAISPFSWYLGDNPLVDGFDPGGLAALAVIPVASAVAGWWRFERRDLMV